MSDGTPGAIADALDSQFDAVRDGDRYIEPEVPRDDTSPATCRFGVEPGDESPYNEVAVEYRDYGIDIDVRVDAVAEGFLPEDAQPYGHVQDRIDELTEWRRLDEHLEELPQAEEAGWHYRVRSDRSPSVVSLDALGQYAGFPGDDLEKRPSSELFRGEYEGARRGEHGDEFGDIPCDWPALSSHATSPSAGTVLEAHDLFRYVRPVVRTVVGFSRERALDGTVVGSLELETYSDATSVHATVR